MIHLASSDKNVTKFLEHVERILKKHRSKLILYIDDIDVNGNNIGGSFDPDNKNIEVCINEEGWLGTLTHEFCHLLLYFKNSNKKNKKENEASEYMWRWLDKDVELENYRIKKYVDTVKYMELECEKLTVKYIKKYSLPIDLEEYVKCANCYIYYYNFIYLHRTWFKSDCHISEMEDILEHMPTTFSLKYNKFDKDLLDKFRKYSKTTLDN